MRPCALQMGFFAAAGPVQLFVSTHVGATGEQALTSVLLD